MSAASPTAAGPRVDDEHVTFVVDDPAGTYRAVGLLQDLQRPRDWTPFRQQAGRWVLDFPRLPVDRMEYQLKLVHRDGTEQVCCDPANPLRVPGAFGDKSVVHLPGYVPPAWASDPRPAGGDVLATTIASRTLKTDVDVRIWTSAGAGVEAALPLLVVHDGREYAELAHLLHYLDAETAEGRLPPLRAALLDPPWPRDEHYSAAASYARCLTTELLPALHWLAPTPSGDRRFRVGMGASLGALAMLHAHRLRPRSFGGLFLQSGSYFRQRYDKQEAGFPRFRRISRFVGEVLGAETFDDPLPVVLTCGRVEENLPNNRAVAGALRRQGYDVELVVNRDSHSYAGWAGTFEAHLGGLLRRMWAGR